MKQFFFVLILFSVHICANQTFFDEAGQRFRIDPKLLKSIAKVESNFNPNAIHKNTNGTIDIGMMQINSIHLPLLVKIGATREDLFNERININFGAFVLAKCFDKYGITLNGINCYNGKLQNNPYAMKVLTQAIKMGSR